MAGPASRVSQVVLTGPLASFADAYRVELRARGYTALTTVNEVRQMARFSRWLEARGLTAADVGGERVEEFLSVQRAEGRLGVLATDVDGFARRAWRSWGADRSELVPVASPSELLLAAFEGYLVSERALGVATAAGYVRGARRFLDGLAGGDGLAGLAAGEVTAAVVCQSAALSVAAARNFVCGLRAFLRFCFLEGLVESDLSAAGLFVAGRRSSPLPRGISRSDAAALLASCDRRTGIGRRDYAVLIILLRLGLRSIEVARMELADLDWRAGELVVRGKAGRQDRLPLPADVGAALAEYLSLRGKRASRHVFLTVKAPTRPIRADLVGDVVQRACLRAGIAHVGAHRLRHTFASELLRAGASMVDISQLLRHSDLATTAGYAKVDLGRLRQVARPWPGATR